MFSSSRAFTGRARRHPAHRSGPFSVNRGAADPLLAAQIGYRHPASCSFKTPMMCSSDKRLRSMSWCSKMDGQSELQPGLDHRGKVTGPRPQRPHDLRVHLQGMGFPARCPEGPVTVASRMARLMTLQSGNTVGRCRQPRQVHQRTRSGRANPKKLFSTKRFPLPD